MVGNVPAEIPKRTTQCLSAIVLVDHLDTLSSAQVVQMGLEGGNTDILVEEFITVGTNRLFPTGKIQVLVVRHVGTDQNVLRFFPFGQKPQCQPGQVGMGLAVGAAGVMNIPSQPRACLDQLTGARWVDVGRLAEGVLAEKSSATFGELHRGYRMMYYRESLCRGLGLEGLYPAIFGETRIAIKCHPPVGAIRRYRKRFRDGYDQVRWTSHLTLNRPGQIVRETRDRG